MTDPFALQTRGYSSSLEEPSTGFDMKVENHTQTFIEPSSSNPEAQDKMVTAIINKQKMLSQTITVRGAKDQFWPHGRERNR